MKVCEEDFEKAYAKAQGSGFYIDLTLKQQIDILLKNIKNDWDFTIIVSGSGEVRVGKSVLAMQIAYYWTYMLKQLYNIEVPFTVEDNIVFDGRRLVEQGNKLGQKYPYSVLIYDEAGADLEGRKSMQTSTQNVLDFYRECGQYNMLNILVIPEYFDLPKGIALSRSIFLLDVFYTSDEEGMFERGHFLFFSRRKKKHLYLQGKKELDYGCVKADFRGQFRNFYPVDEKEYRKKKQEALKKRETKHQMRVIAQRNASWYIIYTELKLIPEKIAQRMKELTGSYLTRQAVVDGLAHFSLDKTKGTLQAEEFEEEETITRLNE